MSTSTAPAQEKTLTPDIHGMSDADFEKLDPSQFNYTPSDDEHNLALAQSGDDADSEDDDLDGDTDPDADQELDLDSDEHSDDDENDAEDSDSDDSESESESDDDESNADADDDTDSDTDENDELDETATYKATHELLMGKFKANGVEMQVSTPQEALRLMQMGANFNKKMTELKPLRQTVKALVNAGIKSPEQLNFLLDLHNKDPKAINKLVKDAGIDPMDLDTSKESDYQPDTQSRVSNAEITLDQVLDSIEDSESGQRTLKIIGSDWDAQSKQILFKNPEIIKGIEDNVQRGVFDVINAEVIKQRALGHLTGVSDIQAYHDVGQQLQAKGGFDHLAPSNTVSKQQSGVKQTTAAKKTVSPANAKKDEADRNKRRKAAGSSSGKSKGKTPEVAVDYIGMSDEEFDRLHGTNQ